jgi:hypothetical protein
VSCERRIYNMVRCFVMFFPGFRVVVGCLLVGVVVVFFFLTFEALFRRTCLTKSTYNRK